MLPAGALPKPTGDRKVLVLVETLKWFRLMSKKIKIFSFWWIEIILLDVEEDKNIFTWGILWRFFGFTLSRIFAQKAGHSQILLHCNWFFETNGRVKGEDILTINKTTSTSKIKVFYIKLWNDERHSKNKTSTTTYLGAHSSSIW